MRPDHLERFEQHFTRWFFGDKNAVGYCLELVQISHVWDDLKDGDDPSRDRIDAAFEALLLDVPTNPFFAAHAGALTTMHRSVILQWHTANAFETAREEPQLPKAYMLRAGLFQIFHMVAALKGGMTWARQLGPEIWRAYDETLEDVTQEALNA